MKIINPTPPEESTPAQTIVRILARMCAKQRLRRGIARRQAIVEAAEKSKGKDADHED
ncbi:hypothetical protein GGD63_006262 [Bradyrhizobium sp. cir1]|uniref:hypothetical protein n=1 Tax=Bradyrhizobium sp. cir1 TaxID=1445730 RepID=UPI0016066A5C|nr:hypothetical protein [Bradyrhizobium sp. cir1]MBB4373439.1 hypothetical protein [Bradyrhizobium sp. cir1]